jgi:hypothetical protein
MMISEVMAMKCVSDMPLQVIISNFQYAYEHTARFTLITKSDLKKYVCQSLTFNLICTLIQ